MAKKGKYRDKYEAWGIRIQEAASAALIDLRLRSWAIEARITEGLKEDGTALLGHVKYELDRKAAVIRIDGKYDWDDIKSDGADATLEEIVYHEVFHIWLGTCGILDLGDRFNGGSAREVQKALDAFTESACDGYATNFRWREED